MVACRICGALLDLLFPRACERCGVRLSESDTDLACAACAPAGEWILGPACGRCGAERPEGAACPECAGRAYEFEGAVAAGRYDGFVRELVHRFKFGGRMDLAGPLAARLADGLRRTPWSGRIEVVVPVPMRKSKILLGRRYNPAELLAAELARRLVRPRRMALAQVRATMSQTKLTGEQRLRNPAGAYAIRRRGAVRGRVVLLVDDVLTTGATASECARTLRAAGARAVYLAVVGR